MSKREPLVEMFKIGDVVRLRSGGRQVTVSFIWNDGSTIRILITYSSKKGKIVNDVSYYPQEAFEKVDNDIKCN